LEDDNYIYLNSSKKTKVLSVSDMQEIAGHKINYKEKDKIMEEIIDSKPNTLQEKFGKKEPTVKIEAEAEANGSSTVYITEEILNMVSNKSVKTTLLTALVVELLKGDTNKKDDIIKLLREEF
jgi:hypothetical protein